MIDTDRLTIIEEGTGNAVRKSGIDCKEIFLVYKGWISNCGYAKTKVFIDESLRKLQIFDHHDAKTTKMFMMFK